MARETFRRIGGSAAFMLAAAIGPRILLAPPDEGGGGGAGDGGGAGAGQGGAPAGGGGQASGDGGVPSVYRPEGLPDHLAGANEKEIIDKLWGAYKPARESIAKFGELGELPKDPTKYGFEPSEKIKPYAANLTEDPVFKVVQEAAHKAGIRDKQFAPFLSAVMEAMIDGDLVQPPVDLAAEKAALLPPEAANLDDAGKNAAIDKRVRDNHARLEMWKQRGLDAASAEALGLTLDTAAGNKAIEFFAAQMKTPQPALGGTPSGGFTEADLKARQADPRGKVGNAKYDAAFAAETTRMYQAFYQEPGRA